MAETILLSSQSSDPDSPHFADQTELYGNKEWVSFPYCDDFIMSLPDGYRTELGTVTSSRISVGQKQRIAIARGLLRDSKILILDEPTSALDPETEEYLVQSLHEAAKDRLVVIIAHRLSTIANADKIVFLDEGRVIEQGGHAELLAREGGRYREFVELQTTAAT